MAAAGPPLPSSDPPRDPDANAQLDRLERFADLMDSRFRIPGTSVRFGLDGLIGLIPGIGDTATAASAVYVVLRARELGARKRVLVRMLGNIAMDGLLGSVPLLGDVFDFAWKANRRNVRLLREDLARQARGQWPGR